MKWSQTIIPTQKETPADAQIVSHQLMIRAGLIRQVSAGVFDFLPLGWRSLRKAAQIVREEMDRIGASEVMLPALQPLELWQKSGRDILYGENLFRLKDRHGRCNVIAPTAEEVITELVAAYVNSYKQLPLTLYQIQNKFRDEFRPRFGLLRVREFPMKDAYSFHASLESLDATYQDMYRAYERICTRCGIPYVVVEAESGPIGGSASHEFTTPCDTGEDIIVTSDKGNYAANLEKAETGNRSWTLDAPPVGELAKVHTPNLPGIEEVGAFMKVKPKNMLKSMIYVATRQSDNPDPTQAKEPWYILAIVRGDHDVNPAKLSRTVESVFKEPVLVQMAPEALARKDDWALGFVGPHAYGKRDNAADDTYLIVDPDAAQGGFWAAGANEIDHHVKYFNWKRDVGKTPQTTERMMVADIRNAIDGDPSPRNDGGKLKLSRGIEVGHVFKLGTKYSEALGANYLDDKGAQHPMIMGCYGIGIGRILISAIEAFHDDQGIIWPAAIAPFSVVITPIRYDGESKTVADRLYEQLNAAGIDTILDDRDARPGFKFADADLIGFPVRINVGDRGLKEEKVELKKRSAAEPELVPLTDVIKRVRAMLEW